MRSNSFVALVMAAALTVGVAACQDDPVDEEMEEPMEEDMEEDGV